jgi:outer membrane receptor protein involved in Fe transport
MHAEEAAAQSTAAPPASEEGGGHATPAAAAADPPSTPRRLSHLGTTYIRTKTGNLVSLAFARKQKELADARRAQMDHKRERLERLVGVVKSVQGARNSAAAARGGGGGRGGGRRGCVFGPFPFSRLFPPSN